MNNLEYAEKKRRRLIEIISIVVVLSVFLIMVFATDLGDLTNTNTLGEENDITHVGNLEIANVAIGSNFTIALDSEGKVWSWGQNNKGQLGNGGLVDSSTKSPVLLKSEIQTGKNQLTNIKQIAAGEYHAVALTNDGKVYMWGYNYFGQAGSLEKRVELYPQLIDMPDGVTAKQIAAGADYTIILTTNGKILGLGDSSQGQLGYYNDLSFTSIKEIEEQKSELELPSIKQIAAGYNHVVALSENGEVYTWGDMVGSKFNFTTINKLSFGSGEKIQEIEAGNGISMALSTSGNIYTWDLNNTPTQVDLTTTYGWDYSNATPSKITLENIVQVRLDNTKDNIAIVNQTFFMISKDNKIYSWGVNTSGQTGTGNTSVVSAPTEVLMDTTVYINKEIDKVASSSIPGIDTAGNANNYDTAYAINADGYVLGWGYSGIDIVETTYTDGSNNFKLLGDGTRSVANYIGSISVKNIVTADIVLDITDDGKAKGKDTKDLLKMLEDGEYITGGRVNLYNSSIKEDSKSALNIKSVNDDIASYNSETGVITGVKQGRTIVEIRSSKNTIYINIEVIGNDVTFPKIESGDGFTLALRADGTVWTWGYNTYLGIRDSEHSHLGVLVPTQIKGLENIKDISVGPNFALILKADGTVWGWGYNGYGQLGDGTTTSTPNKAITIEEPQLVQVLRYQLDDIVTDEKILMPTPTIKKDSNGANVIDESGNLVYVYTENGIEKECYINNTRDEYTDKAGNIVIKKDTDGKLYKWENGAFKTEQKTSQVIGNHPLENIKSISAGMYHSIALDNNGKVWGWGYNSYGHLGLENRSSYETRAKETVLTSLVNDNGEPETIKQIEAGYGGTYIVTNSGNVYTCGYNGRYYYTLTRLTTLNRIIKISVSKYDGSAQALTVNGKVYTFGYSRSTPVLQGLQNVADIGNTYHSNGTIIKFSDGVSGYWTTSTVKDNNEIIKIKDEETGEDITDVMLVCGGTNFYTIVKTDGTVWTTGTNTNGRLGNRTTDTVALPYSKCISYPYIALNKNETTLKINQTDEITATHNYGFNILYSGTETVEMAYTSQNEEIATVNGNIITAKKPGTTYIIAENADTGTKLRVKVNVLDNNEITMPNISTGYYHTVSVKTDGTVWGWGYNYHGELGNNLGKKGEPTKIEVSEKIKDVSAGTYYTLMLTTGGKILALGYNGYGQLGNNTTAQATTPVTVQVKTTDEIGNVVYKDLENIEKISAYNYSSLALDKEGNLYAWGYNSNRYATKIDMYGLKVRDITERLILTEDGRVWEYTNPTSIKFRKELENIVEISSSAYSDSTSYGYNMALDAEGNVYTWIKSSGYDNVSGTDTKIPQKVNFEEGIKIVQIEAGVRVAYAKDEFGNVYTWGKNANTGTLGLGASITSVTTPTKIEALQNIEVMATTKYNNNYNRTFMSNTTGTVFGFGYNGSESLIGNADTTSYYYEPVQVGKVHLGFMDESGKNISRTSIEKGNSRNIQVGFIDSFNIRNQTMIASENNYVWHVVNKDLASVSGTEGQNNTIRANNILGEAIVIAEEIDSEGNKTGEFAKLYVDVVEPNTLVAPKIESAYNHTVSLKADGTVWVWGDNSLAQLGIKGESIISEPRQLEFEDENKPIIVDFATSKNHTLLLTNSGEIYSMGYNYYGQLGHASTKTRYGEIPQKVQGLKDIVKVAAGDTYSLALDKYGRVWMFGYIHFYVSGVGTWYNPVNQTTPKNVTQIGNVNITEFAKNAIDITNENILTKDGEVIVLVQNTNLKPGLKIEGITGKVIKISNTKGAHTAFLTEEGKVYTIGTGTSGQLGNDTTDDSHKQAVQVLNENSAELTNIRDINVGEDHTMAITKNGELYTFGGNAYGQLRSSSVQYGVNLARAYKVSEDNKILKNILVTGGNGFTVVIDETGYAFAWGNGLNSQLGNNLSVGSTSAVRVGTEGVSLDKSHITLQEGGSNAKVSGSGSLLNLIYDQKINIQGVASNNNNVVTAQKTDYNEIEVNPVKAGTTSATLTTVSTTGETFEDVIQITVLPKEAEIAEDIIIPAMKPIEPMTVSGESHTLILKSDGTVWSYGDNTYGQLGRKDIKYSDKVEQVEFKEETPSIIGIAAGDMFSVALDVEGNVYTWGYNQNGQLGLGTTSIYNAEPIKVSGINNIIKIVAGSNQVLALDENGYVYSWGRNTSGSLGIGSTSNTSIPQRITNISGAIDIAAGKEHAMVLTSDGKVYTTGRNALGQLGAKDELNRINFETIQIGQKIAYIEAGDRASVAIDINGKLWVWGNNEDGQLGLGIEDKTVYTPTQVTTLLEKVSSASVGENHIHVVTSSGKLYVAGSNSHGQLGIGRNVNKTNTFVQVSSLLSDVMNSDAGTTYSTVVRKDGCVLGFGDYNHGNLERISLTNSFEPVLISDNTSNLNEYEIVIRVAGQYEINPNGRYKLNVLHKDNSEFTYNSANQQIATVDDKGIITGVEVGTTTIKVTDETGKINTLIVRVIPEDSLQAPSIEGGNQFTAVTNENGTAYLFGNKENITASTIPAILNDSVSFSKVRAGDDFVIAINEDKTVWSWGNNERGQLGLEGIEKSDKMLRLNRNYIKNIVQIDAGNKHAVALDDLGALYVWGDNSNGQLGIAVTDDTLKIAKPTVIRLVHSKIISVSAGGNYSAIVDTTGTAYILKNGSKHEIIGVTGAVKVATGSEYTYILNNEGKVYRVQNNGVLIATQVTSANDKEIVDIMVNQDVLMCLNKDKELYNYGSNANGKLGLGSDIASIATLTKVAQNAFTMGAGYNNTYYINTQGQVFAAGLNTSSELGNGTMEIAYSTTHKQSKEYVKVGNNTFGVNPETVRVSTNYNILVGGEELEEQAENEEKTEVVLIEKLNEFNVFGNKITNIDDYTIQLTDTSKATITEPNTLKIVTKALGQTTLKITNKITKQTEELTIYIIDEELLRTGDIYINDTVKDFRAEASGADKFMINTEGSKPTGNLNIELKYDDNIKVFDEDGNELTVIKDEETNNYKVNGIDLSLALQTLTLQLTPKGQTEKVYEFEIVIYKETIVKIDKEIIAAQDIVNKETLQAEKTFIKYVNPENTTALVEVNLENNDNKTQLKSTNGNIIATIQGNRVLETQVNIPKVENKFILEILDEEDRVEKQYIIKIYKSSIESITVTDIEEKPQEVIANRVNGVEYLEEFSAKINDINNPANITINLGNKNITQIIVDGEELTQKITNSKLVISKDLGEDESKITELEIEITAKDSVTLAEYKEKYILKIDTISSNTNIEKIELTNVNGEDLETPIEARKLEDEANVYEIVMHDPSIEINTVKFITTLESLKAKYSIDSIEYKESGTVTTKDVNPETENRYKVITIYVKAQNGNVQENKVYIYKESENAKIDTIKVTGLPSNREEIAKKQEGTNNYIGKVLKNQDSYKLAIDLVDSYSVIESIVVDGIEDATTLLTQTSGENGKYTFDAQKEILGKTITIVVKPEYDKAPKETYTLVLEEMSDNANFMGISVDGDVLPVEEDKLEKTINGKDPGLLSIIAQSNTANITVYLSNPVGDSEAQVLATGIGELDTIIPFEGEREKTLYLQVTSEDGMNTTIKELKVTKLSNNANIISIILGGNEAIRKPTEEDQNNYIVDISESITTPVIQVVPENQYAKVLIDGEEINGSEYDISDKGTINITVTSEDGTITEIYTLKINKLSSNTNFTKELFNKNDSKVKGDLDFIQDENNETIYNVSIKDNLGDLKLVITPEEKDAKVVLKDASGNVISDNIIPSDISQDITVEITPPDGITREYTIKIKSEHHIVKQAQVTGTNSETVVLDEEDIKNLYKEVRIHPDSTKATVKVTIDTAYTLTDMEGYITYKDSKGNILQDVSGNDKQETVKFAKSGRVGTHTIDLAKNSAQSASIQITITIGTGETEVLNLDIVKGSTEAMLDYVEVTGKTTGDKEKANYLNPIAYTKEIAIDSNDNIFNLNAVCTENGSAKIYKLENEEDWSTVTLSADMEIANNSEITLSSEAQIYVIEVTSEYGGNTQRYKLSVRKSHNNTELTDLKITIDNVIEKQLSEFTYNTQTNMYEVWIPASIKDLKMSDIEIDEFATAKWTDITTNSLNNSNFDEYTTGDTKELNNIAITDISTKYMYIEVTSENGDTKTYTIAINKIIDEPNLEDINVYNVTDKKDEEIIQNEVKLLDAVKDIEITAKGNGGINIKVLKVNNHTVNEKVATEELKVDENVLELNLERDYTYTDEEGNEKTILSSQIKTIVIETTVQSRGYLYYPTYYSGQEKKYELTITREITDSSIVIDIENSNKETITYTSNDFTEATPDENNNIVYELEIKVPENQKSFVIKGIKANNIYATLLHRQESGNTLYVDKPFEREFTKDGRETFEEDIIVKTDAKNDTIYRLKVIKTTSNNEIKDVKVNTYETERQENTDIFNQTMLSPVNKLDIDVTNVEEHATAKIYISSINGVAITTKDEDKQVEYGKPLNGVMEVSKDLTTQLTKALSANGISRTKVETIVVNIEVNAEDETIQTRLYTLNIAVQKSNLISIDGLNVDGNVNEDAKLTAEDFAIGRNPYSTKEIVVPAAIEEIKLTNILCEYDNEAVVTDEAGNVLTDRSLTINLANTEITETKIRVSLRGVTQEFIIKVRKASTDTSIKTVIADENQTDTINTEIGAYVLDIRSSVNPEVQIILNDINAKVISANVNGNTINDIKDNKFTLENLEELIHNATEDDNPEEKEVTIKVTVQAEDKDTTKEYTIKLIRKHVETGLEQVTYEYGENLSKTVNYTYTDTLSATISWASEGIKLTSANTVCKNATVMVSTDVGDVEEPLDANKVYTIEEGQTVTFTITVKSEYGNEHNYTLKVKKAKSNTNIQNIKVNGIIAEFDVTNEIYTSNIRVDENAKVELSLEDENAKLTGVPKVYKVVDGDLQNITISDINNTEFKVDGLSNLYVNDEDEHARNEENRNIIVEFNIVAEDTAVVKTYKLKLTRQHVDTSIQDISYTFTAPTGVSGNGVATSKNDTLEIKVDASIEQINIAQIMAKCNRAEVTIEMDGNKIEQTEAGLVIDLPEITAGDGCIRTLAITVAAECRDITQTYTLNIIRKGVNPSLNQVFVKDEDISSSRVVSQEEGIEAEFTAYVFDTDKEVSLKAQSANPDATVTITNRLGLALDEKYTADENNQNKYITTGKYDLSNETNKNVEVFVKVATEDLGVLKEKIYKITIVRQYNNIEIEEISVKHIVEGITDDSVKFTKEDFKEQNNRYQTETVTLPTSWNQIALGDILPNNKEELTVEITRVSSANPEDAKELGKYEIDSIFDMPEGEVVYFRIQTTAESGRTNAEKPYVLALYKKATNKNISIVIDGKATNPDPEDGIYKGVISVDTEKAIIDVIGENNLNVVGTKITTENLNIIKNTAEEVSNIITFTLKELDKLDPITNKVITLTLVVQPEDTTIETVEYTIQITRQETSAEIKQIIVDGEELHVDNEITHYKYIGKDEIDNTIYTKYINPDITEVTADIIAESQFASIYLNEDYENIAGIGKVENYTVQTTDTLTEVKITIVSEDGNETKDYILWFVKKSDDTSIKELYVNGEEILPNENGDYDIEIVDDIKSIDVKMIPTYQFADVSINGQPFKWQEVEEIIDKINEYALVDGKVKIELRVKIPAQQSITGEEIGNAKYLYITRVSKSNKITEITTDNYNDEITPGDSPHGAYHNGIWESNSTYTINLESTAENREYIDIRIEPASQMANLELYDMDGNLIKTSTGTLIATDIKLDEDNIKTLKVKVSPQRGEAKEYYIDIVPKTSRAELLSINIGGHDVKVIPGKYDYMVDNLGLTGIGMVEAIAEYSSYNPNYDIKYGESTLNIYTIENPSGTGEQKGYATLGNIDFDNTTYVSIAVTSPNGKHTNTYTLWLKNVSDDRSLKEVSYDIGNGKVEVSMITTTNPNYEGEYIIEIPQDVESVDISAITADATANVEADGEKGLHKIEFTKKTANNTQDIVIDIIVTAESGNKSKYKLTIKKIAAIHGKVITEDINKDYSGVNIKILDADDTEIATTITNADGEYSAEVIPGNSYKVVITKEGYLTYTITNIPATYGITRYVGVATLLAGEVAGGDEYIDLVDLVQVNKRARVNTVVDDTNKKYDFNNDGVIDNTDLDILIKNYDKTAEQHSTFEYTRVIDIKGKLLDGAEIEIAGANIELEKTILTNEEGKFELQGIKTGIYTIVVKDEEGNIIGSQEISIVEGDSYKVENNTIIVTKNMSFAEITIRVNNGKVVISKYGEDPSEDITVPVNVTFTGEVTEDGINLTATGEDPNLYRFTFYEYKDGNYEEISYKIISELTKATVNIRYNNTQFNKTHTFYVKVEDSCGNYTTKELVITNTLIKTEQDFVEFSNAVDNNDATLRNSFENQTVTLTKDLDLTGIEFKPIGSAGKPFKGTFNGLGHTISNININSTTVYTGLFGYLENATIKDVGIESGSINSQKAYVGGIAGYAKGNTTIENCYNNASITSVANQVGGIIGYATGKTQILNCYNTGDITGNKDVAGIVGKTLGEVSIENCYNIGVVTGNEAGIGEIVGFIVINATDNSIVTIKNSYYLNTNAIGAYDDGISEDKKQEIENATMQITDKTVLHSALGDEYKTDDSGLNNGYPILKWQTQLLEPKMMKTKRARRKEEDDDDDITLPLQTEYVITSEYSIREHPVTGETEVMHYGIDIAADWQSEVGAIADGIVTFAGENGGYGYCIEIEHNINGEKIYSFYAHLYQIDVQVGETITKGQTIGKVGGVPGTPGAGTSTGAHLHLEIRKKSGSYSSAVDPRQYFEF